MSYFEKNWEIIKKYIVKMDFLGPEYNLENNESMRYQSIPGLIISFITIAACFTISMMFGNEIYEKKLPIVSISQEYPTYSDIKMNDFPFMFSITAPDKSSYTKEDLYSYVHMEISSDEMSVDGTLIRGKTYYDFEICDPSKFKNPLQRDSLNEYLKSKEGLNYFCIVSDSNSMFSNSYYASNSTNINFYVKKCLDKEMIENRKKNPKDFEYLLNSNSTIQNLRNQNPCPANNFAKVQDAQFTVVYINSIVNFYNFAQPISLAIEEATTLISQYLLRRVYMRFTYNKFLNDVGILFEVRQIINFINLFSVVPDDLLLNREGLDKETMIWLALESPKISTVITRQYMKIQDLLAKVGGVINAIVIINRIIFLHYLRFLYIYEVKENALECINQKNLENQILNGLENDSANPNILLSPKTLRNLELIEKLSNNKSNLTNNTNTIYKISGVNRNKQSKFHSSKEMAEVAYIEKYSKVKLKKSNSSEEQSSSASKNNNKEDAYSRKFSDYIETNNSPKLHDFKNCQISYDIENNIIENIKIIPKSSTNTHSNANKMVKQKYENEIYDYDDIFKKEKEIIIKNKKDDRQSEVNINNQNNKNFKSKSAEKDINKSNIEYYDNNKIQKKINKINMKLDIDKINQSFESIEERTEEYIEKDSGRGDSFRGINNESNVLNEVKKQNGKNLKKSETNLNELIKKLKEYNNVKGFFSPTVVNRLQNKNIRDISYCNYIRSLLFCDDKILNEYEVMYRAVRKILDFHTYCKLVVSQYNTTADSKYILHTEKMKN